MSDVAKIQFVDYRVSVAAAQDAVSAAERLPRRGEGGRAVPRRRPGC